MKRMRWSCLLTTGFAATALLFATAALAATDADSGASPQNPPPVQADQPGSQSGSSGDQRVRQIGGRISAIDTAAQTVTVKGILLGKTIKVGSDAQIAVEGKTAATLGDLNVGDRVEVSYHRQGDTLVAERITLTQSKTPKSGAHASAN